MPKCLDCGNTSVFVIASISWDRCYFDEAGMYEDSKNLDTTALSSDDLPEYAPECYDCMSKNVEGL